MYESLFLAFIIIIIIIVNHCHLYVADNFGFKPDERFDCGSKPVDVYPSQRRFPQPLFWDYKVHKS